MVVVGNAGVIAPGKWRWLRALGWMVALIAVVIAAFNLVGYGTVDLVVLASGEHFASRGDIPQSYKLIGIIVAVSASLGAYWGAVRLGERRLVSELSLRLMLPEWAIGCAIGAAMMATIIGSMWLSGWVTLNGQPMTSAARALRDSIQSGVVEELLIRLVIFRMLWRALGVWPALTIAGSFFGIIHITNPGGTVLGSLAIILGEGVGFGLYMLTGRIWASIGAHMAWNFTQGWVFGATVYPG
jgi:membrane protease YdiL (CAAX protease family)